MSDNLNAQSRRANAPRSVSSQIKAAIKPDPARIKPNQTGSNRNGLQPIKPIKPGIAESGFSRNRKLTAFNTF